MKKVSGPPILILMIVVFSFSALCYAQPPDPKIWKPLNSSAYYNKKIITPSPDFLLVWTYKTIQKEARVKRMEEVRQYDMEKSVRYQDYHHECLLWNIDCKNRRIRMEEYIDFDGNGKVIDRYISSRAQWEDVIVGTVGDTLYQKVCLTRGQ